jgi:hypothetical protein
VSNFQRRDYENLRAGSGWLFSCVAVAAFGQNADLTGTWTRSETGSSAICKIEQTDASVSFNLKTHFSAGSLSGGMNGTETYSPDGVEREAKADSGRQRWLTATGRDGRW